jgi:hypothetical protein
MEELDFLGYALFAGMVWIIIEFYWPRLLFVALVLVGWFGASIGAPIYFGVRSALNGEIVAAILTLLVTPVLGFFWFIGAVGAWSWLKQKYKAPRGLLQPWNARFD